MSHFEIVQGEMAAGIVFSGFLCTLGIWEFPKHIIADQFLVFILLDILVAFDLVN